MSRGKDSGFTFADKRVVCSNTINSYDKTSDSPDDIRPQAQIPSHQNIQPQINAPSHQLVPTPKPFSDQTLPPVDDPSKRKRIIQEYGRLAASYSFTVRNTLPYSYNPPGISQGSAEFIPLILDDSRLYSPPNCLAPFPVTRNCHLSAPKNSVADEIKRRREKSTSVQPPAPPQNCISEGSKRLQPPSPLKIVPGRLPTLVTCQPPKGSPQAHILIKEYIKKRKGILRRMVILADQVEAGGLTRENVERALADFTVSERMEEEFNNYIRQWLKDLKDGLE